MATGGIGVLRAVGALAVACCGAGAAAAGPSGYVVMPHPDACRCANEDKGFCEELWEKMRPGHRDRYLTRQRRRHLNNPECPPHCMQNYGYYQTCWRKFPEHTLGCRDCWGAGTPITAPPAPARYAPEPALTPPPAPPVNGGPPTPPLPEIEEPAPEYEPEPEAVTPADETGAFWKDPEWRAGLRPVSGERR